MNVRFADLEGKMNIGFDQVNKKLEVKNIELSETQETLHWVAT